MIDPQQRSSLLNLLWQSAPELKIKRLVCETNHGDFMIDVRDTDIGRTLVALGEYGYREMQRFFDYLPLEKGAGGLIDIGANIGTTCIPLALDKRFKTIISFEPDPYNYSLLEYNINVNKLTGVITPFNLAVGSKPGTAEFELSADNFGDHRVRYQELGTGSYNEGLRRRTTVNCTTLDAMAKSGSIDISATVLIKSDTQGSEGHVLKGAKNILAMRKIPWVIEFWPYGLARSGIPQQEIITIIKENFSSFVELKEDGITAKQSMIENIPDLFLRYEGVRWCNLILLP
jgi:FkbM family methyltransferase